MPESSQYGLLLEPKCRKALSGSGKGFVAVRVFTDNHNATRNNSNHKDCTLLKTMVPVFLVVHVCRAVDRVVGHPRPSLSGFGVPWVSLPEPTNVPLMHRAASRQSANPLWLLECGLVSVSWWSSKQAQRGSLHSFCTRFVFRV